MTEDEIIALLIERDELIAERDRLAAKAAKADEYIATLAKAETFLDELDEYIIWDNQTHSLETIMDEINGHMAYHHAS